MAKQASPRSNISDPKNEASRAIEQLDAAFEELVDQGNLAGLVEMVNNLASIMGLDETALVPFLERVKRESSAVPHEFFKGLEELAREEECDFANRRPFISFGCVTIRENDKKPGEWSLSILDGVQVERVRTRRPETLAARCLEHIVRIEDALSKTKAIAEDIQVAWEVLRGVFPTVDSVPANLLMLLASHGKRLRKLIESADQLWNKNGLSRAQFGFVLSRIQRGAASGTEEFPIRVDTRGAPQGKAQDPRNYIPIPEADSPRRQLTNPRLVHHIVISSK